MYILLNVKTRNFTICHYLSFFTAFLSTSSSLKVNLEGTLSLGSEVLSSLSEFLGKNDMKTRRSMDPVAGEDTLIDIIKTSVLCRELDFCLPLRKFIDEYVITLTKSIENILKDSLGEAFQKDIYEEQLKNYLVIIRYILEENNMKITEDKTSYFWTNTIKQMCAKFQEMAAILISEELQSEISKNNAKKSLNHKVIVTAVLIELKYQAKLCTEHNICIKAHDVTKSLYTLLEQLDNLSEEKIRLFIKYFYEALFETTFYSHLNQMTAHELQVTLNDMAYSEDVPTKDILSTMKKIVKLRLKSIQTNELLTLPNDAYLVHIILSDMDHFYSEYKEPFGNFIQYFINWAISNVRIDKQIVQVLKEMERELWTVSDDLLMKLMNEVKIFLELTVEPEN